MAIEQGAKPPAFVNPANLQFVKNTRQNWRKLDIMGDQSSARAASRAIRATTYNEPFDVGREASHAELLAIEIDQPFSKSNHRNPTRFRSHEHPRRNPHRLRRILPADTSPRGVALGFAFLSTWIIWGSTYLAIRFAVETHSTLSSPPESATSRRGHPVRIQLLPRISSNAAALAGSARQSGRSISWADTALLHWAEHLVSSGLAAVSDCN